MTKIKILKKEILPQCDFEQHPIVESAKSTGGIAYRVEFDYDGHKGIMLSCVSKEFENDIAISLDDFFVIEAERWVRDNPPT